MFRRTPHGASLPIPQSAGREFFIDALPRAKNGVGLAISFLNSVLTLRGVPINCRFGFTKLYHLETD
jgi:hypothetical protein